MPGDLCTAPRIISLSPFSLATDVTLGASVLWLGTRTEAGGTSTLAKSILAAAHDSMDNMELGRHRGMMPNEHIVGSNSYAVMIGVDTRAVLDNILKKWV